MISEKFILPPLKFISFVIDYRIVENVPIIRASPLSATVSPFIIRIFKARLYVFNFFVFYIS